MWTFLFNVSPTRSDNQFFESTVSVHVSLDKYLMFTGIGIGKKGMTSDNWMLNVSGFWFAFVTVSTLWAYFRQVFNLNRHSVFKAQIVLIHLTIEDMITEFGTRDTACKLCWDNILLFPSPHCAGARTPQPTGHLMLSPTLDNDLICCLLIRPWHRMGQYLLCHFLHL